MSVEIDLSCIWNKDYFTYSLCMTHTLNVVPNNYQTVVFDLSLSERYHQTFHRLDATLFNISNQQTVVCIAIALVLTCLFVIIGFKRKSNDIAIDQSHTNINIIIIY